ncbi:hypothetical protein FJZ26_03165 [Candidatus Parvarchaeota archaeon]|nr:hypothetical protein [Candidatus Parvarchaeota archaeon]
MGSMAEFEVRAEDAAKLEFLVVGSGAGGKYVINEVELGYCIENGFIEEKRAIRLGKRRPTKPGGAALKTKTEIYAILRKSGRVVDFDANDDSVYYIYPQGNVKKNVLFEAVLVVAKPSKSGTCDAIAKAIRIGKQIRRDSMVAIKNGGGIDFFKLKQVDFPPCIRG